MSADAVAWVYRHSKATGGTFAVHLAVADWTNQPNDWIFYAPLALLAKKTRVSRETAGVALRRLVELGHLEELTPPNGQAGVYRFVIGGDVGVVFDTHGRIRRPRGVSESRHPEVTGFRGGSDSCTALSLETQYSVGEASPKKTPSAPPLAQEMVRFFVDVSRKFGGEPTPRMKGQVGKEVGRLVTLGKPRRVLRRAVGVLAETGKPASSLEWLVGEQEREVAAESGAAR
jgi:hypothetical protein